MTSSGPDDHTAALILRWPAARPSNRKAMLIMAHMDVVEARRADWSRDPFRSARRTAISTAAARSTISTASSRSPTALLRLRAEGFQPDRDIIVLFTGDEETGGRGAEQAANQWLDTVDASISRSTPMPAAAPSSPTGGCSASASRPPRRSTRAIILTATNPGGHSSRPRPDNAIYALAHTLDRLEHYRFEPMLNDTTRAYFRHRTESASPELAAAINRWLANEHDGAAADLDRGLGDRGRPDPHPLRRHPARGRPCRQCAAAARPGDGQLPDLPRRRSRPPCWPRCARSAQPDHVTVEPVDPAHPTDASPLRADVVGAYTAAVRARHPTPRSSPT